MSKEYTPKQKLYLGFAAFTLALGLPVAICPSTGGDSYESPPSSSQPPEWYKMPESPTPYVSGPDAPPAGEGWK
jgi:hypothetical protein